MFKPTGGVCDLWSEHLRLNPSSFSATTACDDWRTHASIGGTPARLAHTTDTTAYATPPPQESWHDRWVGSTTPARVQAGQAGLTSGVSKGGGPT
jgi:hypothetical protein